MQISDKKVSISELENSVKYGEKPNHIGIIPDRNRKFAEKYNVSIKEAYERGAENARIIHDYSLDLGIHSMSVYVVSEDNLGRDVSELQPTLDVIENQMRSVTKNSRIHTDGVRTQFFGKEYMPPSMYRLAVGIEEDTKNYTNHNLNLFYAYNPLREVADIHKKLIANSITYPTENLIEQYMYTGDQKYPYIDALVRTGGEQRFSGFLPIESRYSELFFLEMLWGEFTKLDMLLKVLTPFQQRERRFGR